MVSETLEQVQYLPEQQRIPTPYTQGISYSVGVMAYNEEANIERTLQALLQQSSEKTFLTEIIVVASGCTDATAAIVQEMMQTEPSIKLLVQERREGKASAINLFLRHAHSPVLIMVGADIIPEKDIVEKLCLHFTDITVGMVGGRPVPVNDQHTFIGHAVHMLWRLHDRMARRKPKLGEVVAFRNVIQQIPTDTAVDEIAIEAMIARQGLELVYEPGAIVYNKGPMTVRDFLKQRRRIHAGHLKMRAQEHYQASTMQIGPILREIVACAPYFISTPRQVIWTLGTIALEGIARLQGRYDVLRNRSHQVWQTVASTKALEDEQRKLRRICNTQSVIVFHLIRADADDSDFQRKHEERVTLGIARKLLPLLRQYVRDEDVLSLNGAQTLVAVLNADRFGAELTALRLKHIIASQQVPFGRHGTTRLLVSFHAVSFALQE